MSYEDPMCMTDDSARMGLLRVLSWARTDVEFAAALGISQAAVAKWRRKGYVPIERVPEVERLTGVPRWMIRPDRTDMFPPPTAAATMETVAAT